MSGSSDRVPSGIPGVDEILHGGFVPQETCLVVGSPGTGKTIFAVQWLRDGVARGERCLLVSLAVPPERIARNVAGFGWSLEGIEVVDLGPRTEDQAPGEYEVFPPSEVERTRVWEGIYEAVRGNAPQRLVIDSATQLRFLSADEYQFRKQILALVRFLAERGCTTLMTFEPSQLERETGVALAVSGIIHLRLETSPDRVIGLRSLEVEKFRGSDFHSGRHPMRITSEGIVVFPHIMEQVVASSQSGEQLRSGLAELDALLGGGIEMGTATIISGPTGAGKTTLGMQFLLSAVNSGLPALLCTFEEPLESIYARCRNLAMGIDAALDDGGLRGLAVSPLQLYPDEFLAVVRRAVEEDGRRVVMLDSLRGYSLAMEQFGSLTAHVQNLVAYLRRNGVTAFLVNEIERLTGDLMLTELGISYIADNILLLRFCEQGGKVVKVVACVKKRLGDFQPELRELRLTDQGVAIGPKLGHLRGVLTGIPHAAPRE